MYNIDPYVRLPFKKMQIYESFLDAENFCEAVEKFRVGRNEKGSAYSGTYVNGLSYFLWARLKRQFPVKVEHQWVRMNRMIRQNFPITCCSNSKTLLLHKTFSKISG